MDYIIVNYHYIRPQKLRGLNPCTEEQFKKQLDYLRTTYTMESVEEVYRAAKTQRPGRFCALTFDDGLKEHYAFAFPLLKRHAIPGTFFLSGEILQDEKVSLTHKLQVLLLHSDTATLVNAFHAFFGKKYHVDSTVRINPKRRFDDVPTANFKETLIALPLHERTAFIDDAFHNRHDEEGIARAFFLNSYEAKAMLRGGMEVGAHGFRHLSLETLSPEEQRTDIELGKTALEAMVGVTPTIFSYPHGRANSATFDILRTDGFTYGVTIKPEAVSATADPLQIPRCDANDFTV